MEPYCGTIREPGLPVVDLFVGGKFKVSVNENFSTLLDFVFFLFWAWVGPIFYFGRKRKPESAF